MKKNMLLICLSLLIGINTYSQPLTGIKNIPGDYANLKLAIEALNNQGVGVGGVVFNVASDYKEVFSSPTAGYITTTTGSAANPITFQKSGTGSNPLITAGTGVGSMDAIFSVAGSDYVTFDGFSIRENADNNDETTWMEWGFAVLKASGTNGSQHITIKNCSVTLEKLNPLSTGIYSNNHTTTSLTQLTVTSTDGANSNLKVFGITIANSYFGIYLRGFADASPYSLYDQNNEIGKDGPNMITNVGGGDFIAYGIYSIYQDYLEVANNTINSATEGSKNLYGIYLTTAINASYNLYGNTVTIQFTSTEPFGNASFNPVYCDMGASGTTNVANIYNNTVTNCTFPASNGAAGVRCMYLLNMGVTANVYGNVISNNTIGGDGISGAAGEIRYFWCQKASTTSGPLVVHTNNVTGNSRIQPTPGLGNTYFLSIAGSGTTLNAYNNLVSNNIAGSRGATHGMYVIFSDNVSKEVHDNLVINLSNADGSVTGLYNSGGTNGLCYNNKIQGISSSFDAELANISGIYHSTGNTYYYNNMISELINPAAIATQGYSYNMLSGFYAASSAAGFFNNTVYLNSTATSPEFGSSAFCALSLTSVNLRNNIFINTSTSTGANGKTVAIRSRNTSLTGFTSNYNDIYAGSPGPNNLLFYNTTEGDQTLAQYQSRVAPNEAQSVTELPPFANIAVSPYDVHLMTNIPTSCESSGIAVSLPPITSDIDGNPRYPNPGYPVNQSFNPTAPDLGADEFGGLPKDLTPPSIVYTPLPDINHGNQRTLTVIITDASGVPINGFGLPVLYWMKNNLGYGPVQGTFSGSDTYIFTFGAGTVLNDVVSYYIVAQDNAAPFPNIGAFPAQGAAGFTANPPVCTTPPSNPSTYRIINDITGIRHVGVGKDYTTLTAAAADLNVKYMAGPVTFILDDNTYPNEIFPIKFNDRPGNSEVNTLTIKPNTGATPVITGTSSGQSIITMNGIDFATIDGSNNGTNSKDLSIENNSSMNNSNVIGISNHGGTDPSRDVTIKNCMLTAQKSYEYGPFGNDLATYVIAINAGGGIYGGGYDNCLITGNILRKARVGISISAAVDNINRNITITNNTIGSADTTFCIQRYGIGVTNSDNTLISANEIMGHSGGTALINLFGIIYYGSCTNTKIHRNKIHDWYSTGTASSGIRCSSENSTTPTEIFNNLIYNIKAVGMNPGPSNNNAYGIFIRLGSDIKIWHNSIYLSGPYLDGSDSYAPSSACIATYTSESDNLDIRDNILRNSMTNPSNPPPGSGATGRAYAIQHSGTAISFTALDYNDYFVDGYNGTIAQTWIPGFGPSGEYVTLPEWQAYTGKDAASLNLNPAFVSDVDPINLMPTNMSMNSVGGQKILQTDVDGATRFAPPDMGAYEWSKNITDYHTLASTNVTENTATLNGDINTNGEIVAVYFDYGTTTSYGNVAVASPATIRSVGTLQPLNAAITGLLPNTTYHYRFWGIPTTSGQSNVYGEDMTFSTLGGIPATISVTTTVSNDTCFNATQTITAGGTPNTFVVASTGHVTMIAGQNIILLPGTVVQPGGYLHGYISNQYCGILTAPITAVKSNQEEVWPVSPDKLFRVYPNPTSGLFTLEIIGESPEGDLFVEIFNMRGDKVLRSNLFGIGKHELSLSGHPVGIYLVRVISANKFETARIIKQ